MDGRHSMTRGAGPPGPSIRALIMLSLSAVVLLATIAASVWPKSTPLQVS